MATKVAQSCPCVAIHAPIPLAFQVHHVRPKAWQGPDTASNKVTICGTCHDNVHHALDEVVRVAYGKGGDGTLKTEQLATIIKPYDAYAAYLIARAVEDIGFKIPHVYTLTPGEHSHA